MPIIHPTHQRQENIHTRYLHEIIGLSDRGILTGQSPPSSKPLDHRVSITPEGNPYCLRHKGYCNSNKTTQ